MLLSASSITPLLSFVNVRLTVSMVRPRNANVGACHWQLKRCAVLAVAFVAPGEGQESRNALDGSGAGRQHEIRVAAALRASAWYSLKPSIGSLAAVW